MPRLQLTEQANPLAQTFRVTEPGGSVITGVGLFFRRAPKSSERQSPITVELRPVSDGSPSSNSFFDNTQVSATAAQIRAVASSTFGSGTEFKFEFDAPVYIPSNQEVAIVAYSTAAKTKYKLWSGTIGEHVAGSTTKLISKQLNSGVLFKSANGTVWSPDQYSDLAFKVYRAEFATGDNVAVFDAAQPGIKRLTENKQLDDLVEYPRNPLKFTNGSNKLRVIHPNHGFQITDKVTLSSISSSLDSSSSIAGVKGSSFLGTRTIDSADPWGYTVTMDSNATSTRRGGADDMAATEQYLVDELRLHLPTLTPRYTRTFVRADATTGKSFAGDETAYDTISSIPLRDGTVFSPNDPLVVMSDANESLRLSGSESFKVKVSMKTDNKFVAPFIPGDDISMDVRSNFIDYQDSANGTLSNRNKLTTIGYVDETEPGQGTTLSKHITIPFQLEETATSIRVYVDAVRPVESDFTVWYRTGKSTASARDSIERQNWVAFQKSFDPPNTSNYNDVAAGPEKREYNFNVYDIPDFDRYQIKITMNSTNSTRTPVFYNLRTIATV